MIVAHSIADAPKPRLPLVTLYLTERCNSRCVTCDYWRTGRDHLTLAKLEGMLPGLRKWGTRIALLSGGEPLLNPEWRAIAGALRDAGIERWLLTSGLSLAKYATTVAELFDAVTVSLDGACAATYQAIRGLDAFEVVCEGIAALARAGRAPGLRVTVQRANYREMPRLVRLARGSARAQISFLAVDVGNPHAFGRDTPYLGGLALEREDVAELDAVIGAMRARARAGIHEWLHRRITARSSHACRPTSRRCSATAHFPASDAMRRSSPRWWACTASCRRAFSSRGPMPRAASAELEDTLDAAAMRALRDDIRAGRGRSARAAFVRCGATLPRHGRRYLCLPPRQPA